jgi:hypothetical protein
MAILRSFSVVAEAEWVFFEFVSCAFAVEGLKSSLLDRITCWDLVSATNGCQQDDSSIQVAQVRTTCKEVKATVMAWIRSQNVSAWPPGMSGSVTGESQETLVFGHSF